MHNQNYKLPLPCSEIQKQSSNGKRKYTKKVRLSDNDKENQRDFGNNPLNFIHESSISSSPLNQKAKKSKSKMTNSYTEKVAHLPKKRLGTR